MMYANEEGAPRVDETAYVAPTAVLSGDVRVGPGTCIRHGAIVTADGGPVEIGADCMIMETAVIRGTPRHPTRLGDRVLVGPRSHLSGCTVGDDAFLATGVTVFNGARIGPGAELRINAVVHVNSRVSPGDTVPIGWVAVGDRSLPPEAHDDIWSIQRELDFPGTVWGTERTVGRGERTRRYARGLIRRLAEERPVGSKEDLPDTEAGPRRRRDQSG